MKPLLLPQPAADAVQEYFVSTPCALGIHLVNEPISIEKDSD